MTQLTGDEAFAQQAVLIVYGYWSGHGAVGGGCEGFVECGGGGGVAGSYTHNLSTFTAFPTFWGMLMLLGRRMSRGIWRVSGQSGSWWRAFFTIIFSTNLMHQPVHVTAWRPRDLQSFLLDPLPGPVAAPLFTRHRSKSPYISFFISRGRCAECLFEPAPYFCSSCARSFDTLRHPDLGLSAPCRPVGTCERFRSAVLDRAVKHLSVVFITSPADPSR